MSRLNAVLTHADLPISELCAARLDGEVYAMDTAFAPVDCPDVPAARARSLVPYCQGRLIAEQLSAAWIWGALHSPPCRHELCASLGARARPAHPIRTVVREVVIGTDDVVELGGIRVTTPLRTIADLARFSARFGDVESEIVARLCALGGVSVGACIDDLSARHNLPNKRRAISRLRSEG